MREKYAFFFNFPTINTIYIFIYQRIRYKIYKKSVRILKYALITIEVKISDKF